MVVDHPDRAISVPGIYLFDTSNPCATNGSWSCGSCSHPAFAHGNDAAYFCKVIGIPVFFTTKV